MRRCVHLVHIVDCYQFNNVIQDCLTADRVVSSEISGKIRITCLFYSITLQCWTCKQLIDIGGWRPFHLKFALRLTHPLWKCQFRQISTCNISTIRASEKSLIMTNRKSTTGFPTSYRWSAYITPKSRKGVFWLKFNFSRVKSAAKFFCVKTSSSKVVL